MLSSSWKIIPIDELLSDPKFGVVHPWQRGPAELISHALRHMQSELDSDRRVAFLLMDVGVETLLKTYLSLPEGSVPHQLNHSNRAKARHGNFHEVVSGIANDAPHMTDSINLDYVEHYHQVRNKLYHDGNGINVTPDQLQGYSEIAVNLLRSLLDVDLSELFFGPEIDSELREFKQTEQQAIAEKRAEILALRGKLRESIWLATEYAAPRFLLPSAQRQIRQLPQYDPFNEDQTLCYFDALVIGNLDDRTLTDVLTSWGLMDKASAIESLLADQAMFFLRLLENVIPKSDQWPETGLYNLVDSYPEVYEYDDLYNTEKEGFDHKLKPASEILETGDNFLADLSKLQTNIQQWANQKDDEQSNEFNALFKKNSDGMNRSNNSLALDDDHISEDAQ